MFLFRHWAYGCSYMVDISLDFFLRFNLSRMIAFRNIEEKKLRGMEKWKRSIGLNSYLENVKTDVSHVMVNDIERK